MREKLFERGGGLEFNLWRQHKETHRTVQVIENDAVSPSVSVQSLLFTCTSCSSSNPPSLSNHSGQNAWPPHLHATLKWPHVPLYLSSQKQLLRSAKKRKFKKQKSSLVASGCERTTQAEAPNHRPTPPPPTTALIKTAAPTNQSPSDSSFRLN